MASLLVAYNNAAVAQLGGAFNSGGNFNTGKWVQTSQECIFETFVTNCDTIYLPAAYVANATDFTATLMDTSENVLGTVTPTLLATSFVTINTLLFTLLTTGTTYFIRFQYHSGDIAQSDAIFGFSNATGTPSVSYPTFYGPVLSFNSTIGGTDITTHTGLESLTFVALASGYYMAKNTYKGGGKIRIKGNCSSIRVRILDNTGNMRVAWAVGTGANGTIIGSGSTRFGGNTGVVTGWTQVASGISTGSSYIFDIDLAEGCLLAGIMLVGGTGIDLTASGSTAPLLRALDIAWIGDSRVAQKNGTNDQFWLGSIDPLGHYNNLQELNLGIPTERLDQIAAGAELTDLYAYAQKPNRIVIDGGINDLFTGFTAAQTASHLTDVINSIRGTTGFAVIPIYVEAIKPSSAITNANLVLANAAFQTAISTLVGAGDAHLFYVNTAAWGLADPSYSTGGTFNTTNFADFVHLNSASVAGGENPGPGYSVEYGFLLTLFGNVSGGPFQQNSQGNLTGGINGGYSGS